MVVFIRQQNVSARISLLMQCFETLHQMERLKHDQRKSESSTRENVSWIGKRPKRRANLRSTKGAWC